MCGDLGLGNACKIDHQKLDNVTPKLIRAPPKSCDLEAYVSVRQLRLDRAMGGAPPLECLLQLKVVWGDIAVTLVVCAAYYSPV